MPAPPVAMADGRPAGATPPSGAGRDLVVALSGGVTATDPHLARTGADFQYYEHVFDTLVTRDGFATAPRLATSWRSDDHLTWTFLLDPAARFADGQPVTPRDVAYSLCRFQEVSRDVGREPLGLVSVAAGRPGQITLVLAAPYRLLPAALSLAFIMQAPDDGSAGGPQGCDPDRVRAGLGRHLTGSGPFIPAAGSDGRQDRHLLTLSPLCWTACPPWQRLVLVEEPDARERLRLLVTGEVDIMEDVAPVHERYLRGLHNLALSELPTDRTLLLTFNLRPALPDGSANPLADPHVRRAVSLAVDRHLLVERGLETLAGPAWQLAQPGMEGYQPDRPLTRPPRPDIARELLVRSGHADGLTLELLLPLTRITDRPRVADALAGLLRAVGIQVTVQSIAAGEMRQRIIDGDFQMMFAGLGLTAGSAMEGYAAIAGTPERDSTINPSGYRNEELQTLLLRSRGATAASIPALAAQATAILETDLPMVPLLHIRDLVAHRQGLEIRARDTARAFGRITVPACEAAAPPPD
ncbi:ABC transporter substrate-binding protein [Niveispirillum fermenti]|uniref:ABC transporter substrate-binding protein n=1 Tax=Niveispirillum fermenti TaxID=1233113 RepID=UPI003A86CE66